MTVSEEMVARGCHAACVHEHGSNLTEGSSLLTGNAKKAWEPFVRTILTAALSEQVVVPDGWQLVPKKPDAAMRSAGAEWAEYKDGENDTQDNDVDQFVAARVYKAMIAAAPPPVSPTGESQSG